jgi:hypothetical protein
MPMAARTSEASRAPTSADAVRTPSGRAYGARCRARAVVALLLLLLLPSGLLHRSVTGACRSDHRAVAAASAPHDAGGDAATVASPAHERVAAVDEHDHGGAPSPDGAAAGACGPAIVAERAAPAGTTAYRSVLPAWRARSPLALAPPPPAPPPRLG